MANPPKVPIPPLALALLDSYRVSDDGPVETTKDTTFVPHYSRPSGAQLEGIGRVAATWAVLEHLIERALSRLAFAPDFPALALTADLGIDNRLHALVALVKLHQTRYHNQFVSAEVCDALLSLKTTIAKLKDRRNRTVHRIWLRQDDEKMLGVRFRVRLPADPKTGRGRKVAARMDDKQDDETMTVSDLAAIAGDIQEAADNLHVIVQLLPLHQVPPPKRPEQ